MTIKIIMLSLSAIILAIALLALWIMTPRIEEEDPPEFI